MILAYIKVQLPVERSIRMNARTFLVTAVCITCLTFPFPVTATELSGHSRTYLQTRELTDGTRLTPLYEYLDLRTDSLGSEAISFSAGGWYRYYLQSTDFDKKDAGDLQYAYLTIRKTASNASVNIGRILVHEGAASSHLDGISAHSDLWGGFIVGAFGGIPLETELDSRSGDSVYGGRIAHSVNGISTIGVSYLKEKNNSTNLRTEEGVDVWLRPVSKIQLMGISTYNSESKNWMQHQYHAALGPFAWLSLNVDASKTWYREYFTAATTSAFSFANLDPNEVVTSTGGSLVAQIGESLSVIADYHTHSYEVLNGSATYAGGTMAYRGTGLSAGAGLHRMDGPSAALRYDEQRVYFSKRISRADLTLDLSHLSYDQAINGGTATWCGSAALGYTVSPRLRLVVDGDYTKTPDITRDVRGMLTVLYSFDLPLASAATPKHALTRQKQPSPLRERS